MVEFSDVATKVLKAVENRLKTEKCPYCKSKIDDKSEQEWGWKPKSPNNVSLKIRCAKCNKINRSVLKF